MLSCINALEGAREFSGEFRTAEILDLKIETSFFPVLLDDEMGRESTEMKAPFPLMILASESGLGKEATIFKFFDCTSAEVAPARESDDTATS